MKTQIKTALALIFIVSQTSFLQIASAQESVENEPKSIEAPALTEEESHILKMGPYRASWVVGGILGIVPGFGLGHVVQERWPERGWIFTLSEVASLSIISNSSGSSMASAVGAIIFIAAKVIEGVDVWVTPIEHNIKYRRIKKKLGEESDVFLIDQNPRFMVTSQPLLTLELATF